MHFISVRQSMDWDENERMTLSFQAPFIAVILQVIEECHESLWEFVCWSRINQYLRTDDFMLFILIKGVIGMRFVQPFNAPLFETLFSTCLSCQIFGILHAVCLEGRLQLNGLHSLISDMMTS